MSKSLFVIFFFGLSLPLASFAQMRSIAAENFLLCKHSKEVRSLHIQQNNEGCSAIYTKDGKPSVIGKGKNRSSCQPIIQNVQTNLQKGGWKCKNSQDASIVTHAGE